MDRLLGCGLCYEENGEEVHPHPECPIVSTDTQPRSHTMTDALHTPAPSASLTLTFDQAKALLERAVEEKGKDFRYTQPKDEWGNAVCVYFDPDTKAPSCLVGHVLQYAGVTAYELESSLANFSTDVDDLYRHDILKADGETLMLLTIAQSEQDMGQTWGDSVDEALSSYADRLIDLQEDLAGMKDDPFDDYDY
jgi:hypothetical protein